MPLPLPFPHKLGKSRTSQALLRRWEVWLPLWPETGFAESQGGKVRTPSLYIRGRGIVVRM